jgi:hypothetical protein
MTRAQALKWARQQWGEAGAVHRRPRPHTIIAKGGPMKGREVITGHVCLVGESGHPGRAFAGVLAYYGEGPTWAVAVDDAKNRIAQKEVLRGFATVGES